MKIGYLDCSSGISGDMMLGALVDAGVPLLHLDEAVRSLGLPGVSLTSKVVMRCGFRATKVDVVAPHEHAHRSLSQILEIIDKSCQLTQDDKLVANQIFGKIAAVEAEIHGVSVDEVHFHEVGAADSIADIVGTVVGLNYLGLDVIISSPVPTGCGTVEIAHGRTTVPAPATAALLTGVPIAASDVPFELTTPTGAAFLATFVRKFGPIPSMSIERIGYGAGGRDLEQQPNLLRLFIGNAVDVNISDAIHQHDIDHQFDQELIRLENQLVFANEEKVLDHEQWFTEDFSYTDIGKSLPKIQEDEIWVLETNLDDVSGEIIGYCIEKLWELDVLDVYTTAIMMKKNRPGVVLTVLTKPERLAVVESMIFRETTTLGIRKYKVKRTILDRSQLSVQTVWGAVWGKVAVLPDGTTQFTPEYESAKKIAKEHDVPLLHIYETAVNKFQKQKYGF